MYEILLLTCTIWFSFMHCNNYSCIHGWLLITLINKVHATIHVSANCSIYDKTTRPLGQQTMKQRTNHRGTMGYHRLYIILPFSHLQQKQYTLPLAWIDKIFSLLLRLSSCGDKPLGARLPQRKLVVWAAFLAKLSHLLQLIKCVIHVESNKQSHSRSDCTEQAVLGFESNSCAFLKAASIPLWCWGKKSPPVTIPGSLSLML